MQARLLLLAAGLFLVPVFGLADSVCVSGTVASLVGQTCMIGDLTFTFNSYTPGGNGGTGFDASQVSFAPIIGGFELSGDFSAVYSGQSSEVNGEGTLNYTVTSGAGDLNAVVASLAGASFSLNPSSLNPSDTSGADVFAENHANVSSASPAYLIQSQMYASPVHYSNYNPALSYLLASSTSGVALFGAEAYSKYLTGITYTVGGSGTASTSFTSADFTFSEAPSPVPEPNYAGVMLPLSLIMFGVRRRIQANGKATM